MMGRQRLLRSTRGRAWGFFGPGGAHGSPKPQPVSYCSMAKGWKIRAVRPGRGASGATRDEVFLVAMADQAQAIQAVRACLPDAEITAESEASPDILAQFQVNEGEMFVLPADY